MQTHTLRRFLCLILVLIMEWTRFGTNMINTFSAQIHFLIDQPLSRGSRSLAGLVSVIFYALLSTGCVTVSPPGKVAALSVSDVQQGETGSGALLRWGGTVVKVHNQAEVTVIEIVSRPLMRSGRPKHNDVTDGRFLAEVDGFLDPQIIKPGRDISVIGLVDRVDNGQIGEANYAFPVMSVSDHRVWKPLSEVNPYRPYSHYYFDDGYWRGWPHRRRSSIHGKLTF